MTSYETENIQDLQGDTLEDEFCSLSGIGMDSTDISKIDTDFYVPNETLKSTPRSNHSGASSSEVFSSPNSKMQQGRRPLSARRPIKSPLPKPTSALSSIPLPVKSSGPIKVPSLLKNARSVSRSSSLTASKTNTVANKHTLEIQFINKNKRYQQMKKELLEKQKPVLDLYQSLSQIKKKLEELGKCVKLDEVKLIPYNALKSMPENNGAGEELSMEVVDEMKKSIEDIPKTLLDICKNLLSRRALIVDLLESVARSEVDTTEVQEKVQYLKNEGSQLENSLDTIIKDHESKINELVNNWQKLLTDKQAVTADNKVENLENQLKEQEKLTNESSHVIYDLQRKLEDRRIAYDKSVAELNGIINTLRDQIKKLEQDLESERKASVDFKSRNNTNAQNLKNMRGKITELENEKKNSDAVNSDLQKKIRLLQDQIKHKEAQWTKDKDELHKNLKHQENLLQKLTADKNTFETRLESIEDQKITTEEQLRNTIQHMEKELCETKQQLQIVAKEKDDALEKCAEFEGYIARMGIECKENMNKVNCSIEWGKATREANSSEAENYIQDIAKNLRIRELEDKVRQLERERIVQFEQKRILEEENHEPTETEKQLCKQQECITKYQLLLEESENKLKEKSTEVANLRSEIRQLKVRQEALEEQNYKCPTEELQKMVEEGRHKLNDLMNKSIESEQKLEYYTGIIEKQTQQMSEMENLLRYRENMSGVLKASRDELVLEKESLTRYSQDMRAVLAGVTKESKMKDRLIAELQEKIDLRERQISKLEKEVKELEANLIMTNEKRFKLQETLGVMEKELQSTKAHVNQLADINTRYENQFKLFNRSKNRVSMTNHDYLQRLNYSSKQSEPCNVTCSNSTLPFINIRPDRSKDILYIRQTNNSIVPSKQLLSNFNSVVDKDSFIFAENKSSSYGKHQHVVNSRSLIGLSLKTVDFLKTKLNYLTSVDTCLLEEKEKELLSRNRKKYLKSQNSFADKM